MLKVGLIGCGFMGEMHANCYKNIEGVELAAVADIRKEKADALSEGTNAVVYETGKELIEKARVDIIDICLPSFLHAEHAILAMDKAKYVFVEKPVALTNEEAQSMIKKQAETDCNVQIGQVIRFWDEYVKLKELMAEGSLGKVINANFRRISPIPTWGWNDWLLDENLSGGAAQDLHIHDIDYVLSLFGEPKDILSAKNTLGGKNSYINSLLSYDDFVVTVEGTWGLPGTHPFSATFRVVFDNGVLSTESGKLMLYTNDAAEEIEIEKKDIGAGAKGGNISDLGGYYNELVYFTDCAKSGAKVEKATLKDAADSLRFVLAEIKNAKN